MPAILFGSISTLADTSEMQRQAFNDAFAEHGLTWTWDVDDYRAMLTGNGGAARVADYAEKRGDDVDAQAVHQRKSELFQHALSTSGSLPRPGVVETIDAAREAGWKVALVTTTSGANLDAVFEALAPGLTRADFDVVVDSSNVEAAKPDPAAFEHALRELGEDAEACVAVEDNVGGLASAHAAGITCVAFPNENTAGHDFGDAPHVDRLVFDDLAGMSTGR